MGKAAKAKAMKAKTDSKVEKGTTAKATTERKVEQGTTAKAKTEIKVEKGDADPAAGRSDAARPISEHSDSWARLCPAGPWKGALPPVPVDYYCHCTKCNTFHAFCEDVFFNNYELLLSCSSMFFVLSPSFLNKLKFICFRVHTCFICCCFFFCCQHHLHIIIEDEPMIEDDVGSEATATGDPASSSGGRA